MAMEIVEYFVANSKDLAIAMVDFINFAEQYYLATNLPIIESPAMVDFINFAELYYLAIKLPVIGSPVMDDFKNFAEHYLATKLPAVGGPAMVEEEEEEVKKEAILNLECPVPMDYLALMFQNEFSF